MQRFKKKILAELLIALFLSSICFVGIQGARADTTYYHATMTSYDIGYDIGSLSGSTVAGGTVYLTMKLALSSGLGSYVAEGPMVYLSSWYTSTLKVFYDGIIIEASNTSENIGKVVPANIFGNETVVCKFESYGNYTLWINNVEVYSDFLPFGLISQTQYETSIGDAVGSFEAWITDVPVSEPSPSPSPSPSPTPTPMSTDWTTFGYNNIHSGGYGAIPPNYPSIKWSTKIGGSIYSTPAYANGYVYIANRDNPSKLFCLNALTGGVVWNFTLGSYVQDSSPVIAGGIVFIGSVLDDTFWAVNASTGMEIWHHSFGSVFSTATVVDGNVFFGDYSGRVWCLDALTGSQNWVFSDVRDISYNSIYTGVTVADGKVYFGSTNGGLVRDVGRVFALDETTGGQIWNFSDGLTNFAETTPAVSGGVVFIPDSSGRVYALDAVTGSKIWNYTLPMSENAGTSTISVFNGVVFMSAYGGYISSPNGVLYALNAASGEQIWNYSDSGIHFYGSTAVLNNVVYIESADNTNVIYALDFHTGTKLWTVTLGDAGSGSRSSPVVVNGLLYAGGRDGVLYALGTYVPSDSTPTPGPTSGGGGGGGFGGNSPSPKPSNSSGYGNSANPIKGILDFLSKIPPWAIWVLIAILVIAGLAGVAKGNKKGKGAAPSRSFSNGGF